MHHNKIICDNMAWNEYFCWYDWTIRWCFKGTVHPNNYNSVFIHLTSVSKSIQIMMNISTNDLKLFFTVCPFFCSSPEKCTAVHEPCYLYIFITIWHFVPKKHQFASISPCNIFQSCYKLEAPVWWRHYSWSHTAQKQMMEVGMF